jgi:hypothetical protein
MNFESSSIFCKLHFAVHTHSLNLLHALQTSVLSECPRVII